VNLQDVAPVMKGGTFIDLSYHDSASEVARWNLEHEHQVIVPRIDARNYDDTIALISCLDDVVTVTTSVAHVCGALGKKAHVLVPEVAQWRYAYHFNGGTEMLWYSPDSVKLYRQKPGEADWSPAIKRVARDI
jgi:hypothetical protein